MNPVDKAVQTQLENIQTRTGKSLDQLYALVRQSGLGKHGEIRSHLKETLGMGHGDANTLTHFYLRSLDETTAESAQPTLEEIVDGIYSGAKAVLRPIHERLMIEIHKLGPFEIAPKKGYLSLRRKKQFAMITPKSKTRVEVGLNVKGLDATSRLIALPAGRMCQYKVDVTEVSEVDPDLIAWIAKAYNSAG